MLLLSGYGNMKLGYKKPDVISYIVIVYFVYYFPVCTPPHINLKLLKCYISGL